MLYTLLLTAADCAAIIVMIFVYGDVRLMQKT